MKVNTSGGHLVIATCNEFPLGKWGEVSEATNRDHDQINYLLSHELIGKFLPENVHLLKNPSTNEFKDTMSHLRKEVESSGFVVIVLATHVVKVVKGEKERPKEHSYFAFHNSVWGTPIEIAESCISLSAFCGLVNKIPCAQKTLILNYAHVAKPRMALFPSSKILYPPQDFLSKLCEQAKCAVVACCAIGTPAKEYLRHSAYHLKELIPTEPATTGGAAAAPSLRNRVFNAFHHTNKELYNRMLVELMSEWGIKPFPEVTKSPRPIKPVATWERKDDDITIILPNQKEVRYLHQCFATQLALCFVTLCNVTCGHSSAEKQLHPAAGVLEGEAVPSEARQFHTRAVSRASAEHLLRTVSDQHCGPPRARVRSVETSSRDCASYVFILPYGECSLKQVLCVRAGASKRSARRGVQAP